MATKNLSDYDKEKLPNAGTYRFGIVVSDWNSEVTYGLKDGAINTLIDLGTLKENIEIVHVPGSVEIVYGAAQLCKKRNLDALITIGCVIRGETAHFDYVCKTVTDGVTYLNSTQDIPVIFCVLTDDNVQQSLDRSGGELGNKGVEAGVTAVRMAELKNKYK